MARTNLPRCLMAALLLSALPALSGCGGAGSTIYLRRNEVPITDVRAGLRDGTFAKLDGIVSAQADRGAIRSGAIVIRRRGQRVYANSWGTTTPDGPVVPVTPASPFDVASLTKPLAGVPCGLLLLERIDLTPEFRSLVPRLLNHSSGFDDETCFPPEANQCAITFGRLLRRDLGAPDRYRYANANYLMLTWLGSERDPFLADKLQRRFWGPLGLKQTAFAPIDRSRDPVWSGETRSGYTLVGEPFDPLADALLLQKGGPVGHSGLFASADDVALFAENLLAAPPENRDLTELRRWVFGEPIRMVDSATGEAVHVTPGGMVSPVGPPLAPAGSAPGRYFCHTGYTGCLMWVDTEEGVSLALLTNSAATKSLPAWQRFSTMILTTVQEGTRP